MKGEGGQKSQKNDDVFYERPLCFDVTKPKKKLGTSGLQNVSPVISRMKFEFPTSFGRRSGKFK